MTISVAFLVTAMMFFAISGAVSLWDLLGEATQRTWVKVVFYIGAACLLAAIWSGVAL